MNQYEQPITLPYIRQIALEFIKHSFLYLKHAFTSTQTIELFLRKRVLHLNHESATLNRVNKDESTGIVRVAAPATDEHRLATAGQVVVLGVGIEPGDFPDAAARRLGWDRRDVENGDAGAVVALVGVLADDILVVIDGGAGPLVVASLLGLLEVADVPDVGDGAAVGGGTTLLDFIVFVVHDQPFLVLSIENPALVGVGGSFVRSDRNGYRELLVRYVICID